MKVFVTVGSTQFPELLETLFSSSKSTQILQNFIKNGFYELIIQSGSDSISNIQEKMPTQLQIIQFNYKDTLTSYFESADLIITHAGSSL